jgi:hypothetical protein
MTNAINSTINSSPNNPINNAANNLAPSAADPLAQLRDIHLPAPIGWWPPAPGWWLLGVFILCAGSALIYFLLRRYKQRRYRRLALQNAKQIYAQWKQQRDPLAFIQALNRLLKQTALVAFPHRPIAALSGAAWLGFLDSNLPQPQFDQPATRVLADVYRNHVDTLQPEALLSAVEYWLRRHRQC